MKRVSAGVGVDRRGVARRLPKRAAIVIEGASSPDGAKFLADRLTPEQRERIKEEFGRLLDQARLRGDKAVSVKVVVKDGGRQVVYTVPAEG